MGLFDGKNSVNGVKNTVPPEVAECDAKLNALAQQKRNLIYHMGELFVGLNNATTVAGTEYESTWKELEKNALETDSTSKRRLAVQGLRKCDKCGFILALDSVFCNKCGEKQSELTFGTQEGAKAVCPDCGATYAEGAAFCTNCGKKLS